MGTDRIQRAARQCRFVHEHSAVEYGGVCQSRSKGYARTGFHTVCDADCSFLWGSFADEDDRCNNVLWIAAASAGDTKMEDD